MAVITVGELGEFGLIDHINGLVSAASPFEGVVLGIGDDTACWRPRLGLEVATTDSLVEGVHFLIGLAAPEELGWKALAVNLSDVAAMGGVPGYALVSLALPPHTPVEWVTGLYRGLLDIARTFGVGIVGGDVHSASQIVVTAALWGTINAPEPLARSGARAGDRIAVTGTLGASAGGLRLLKEGRPVYGPLREAHLRPRPQIESGQGLLRRGVKAAIDISDGLLADLGHLCQSSGVGASVVAEMVPVDPNLSEVFGSDALALALSGGEDYQLLFTAPSNIMEKVQAEVPFTDIGEVTERGNGVEVVDASGQPIALPQNGWQHFGPR
ncbi:MAG: thiamine-phosphate kinase [Dehalococcoidia bacterium]|jgi:thiamine-monophosphate kinase|nr:thiamine-phosphate kinase [Dehalococcoidia bacterium]MDP7470690.1 thiamine-phosphate kinase [Dehalococcoidia bacterium]